MNAQLTFGNAAVPLILNARGQGRATQGSLMLKLKPSVRDPLTKKSSFAGGDMTFKATLTHGDWGAAWGVDPAALLAATTKDISLSLLIGDKLVQAQMTVNLLTKPKGAKFFK